MLLNSPHHRQPLTRRLSGETVCEAFQLDHTWLAPGNIERAFGQRIAGWVRFLPALFLAFSCWTHPALAQDPLSSSASSSARLSRAYFKNGDETLRAFGSISRAARNSVVKLDLD